VGASSETSCPLVGVDWNDDLSEVVRSIAASNGSCTTDELLNQVLLFYHARVSPVYGASLGIIEINVQFASNLTFEAHVYGNILTVDQLQGEALVLIAGDLGDPGDGGVILAVGTDNVPNRSVGTTAVYADENCIGCSFLPVINVPACGPDFPPSILDLVHVSVEGSDPTWTMSPQHHEFGHPWGDDGDICVYVTP
jgi:hypothetical protein